MYSMWDIEDAIAMYRGLVEKRGVDAGRGPWEQTSAVNPPMHFT